MLRRRRHFAVHDDFHCLLFVGLELLGLQRNTDLDLERAAPVAGGVLGQRDLAWRQRLLEHNNADVVDLERLLLVAVDFLVKEVDPLVRVDAQVYGVVVVFHRKLIDH